MPEPIAKRHKWFRNNSGLIKYEGALPQNLGYTTIRQIILTLNKNFINFVIMMMIKNV